MKKKWLTGFSCWKCRKKIWRIMRLTIFLLFGLILSVSANSYSQTTRMDINLTNSSINDIMQYVEENSEFIFLYRKEDLNVSKKININLDNASIDQILNKLLANQNVTYDVYERQIVIRKAIEGQLVSEKKQDRTVKGMVADNKGNPLPGVTVLIKGTTKGTVTDVDGKYTLASISENDVLIFSFVGMKTQTIEVAGESTINVILVEDAIGLDEVVAIGYGSVKKSDLTGSVASVSVEDFENSSSVSVTEALQGRAAGVQISTGDAAPGGGINIRIRGTSTINGTTEPLYIVDGFPINSNSDDLYVVGGIAEGEVEGAIANKVPPNPLSAINPNDIESIEILKDASATAIYGSRGANGVILIKTKRWY